MGVKHIFLALLSKRSMHGYELKNSFEELVSDQWPLNFGQVYTTLTRLERDELLYWEDIPQGDKPDKKVYHITDKGRDELIKWFIEKPEWKVFPDEMAFKFVAFSLIERDEANKILNEYSTYLMQLLRQLTILKEKSSDNEIQLLIIERNILMAEADIKWVDLCIERLGL